MATDYPGAIDNLTNPSSTDDTVTVSHAAQHANANDAIEAIENKLGIDSSADTGSIDYKLTNSSSSNPGHKHTLAQGATDVTASAAELNYVDGVTSAIQTQLNAKASSTDLTTHANLTTAHGATGANVGTTNTQTLTNKRVTPRIGTTASSATPSINVDNVDQFNITALATNITSMTSGLSGTPTDGQKLIIRIIDDGTPRTIAWGSSYAERGGLLPTTTTASKYIYVGLIYNSVASKWDCVASVEEA